MYWRAADTDSIRSACWMMVMALGGVVARQTPRLSAPRPWPAAAGAGWPSTIVASILLLGLSYDDILQDPRRTRHLRPDRSAGRQVVGRADAALPAELRHLR